MPTYSFRKLHLTTRRDVVAEFGAAMPEPLILSLQNHPYLFKVLAWPNEFPAELSAKFKQLGARFRPITSNTGYLFADLETLQELAQSPQLNSPATKIFAGELGRFLARQQRGAYVLPTKPQPLPIGSRALIMGVLNCTPDSFYDGGRFFSPEAAIAHGQRLAEAGADMIDIGGESTRPKGVYGGGAEPVPAEEEKRRVLPVIEALAKTLDISLSIDTYKAEVAAAAVQAGASLVNDISGFQFDPQMPATVAQLGVPVVIMHTKGSPADMQSNPAYENLLDELYLYFEEQIELARAAGIAEDCLIIDPGLGFGKRVQDNYEILRRLPEFRGLGCPILVGPSRKSFVGKALNLPPEQRLEGTAAAVAAAVMNGAHLIRVHDVREMRRVATIAELIAGRTEAQ
jgi:dihydropteroate synthase